MSKPLPEIEVETAKVIGFSGSLNQLNIKMDENGNSAPVYQTTMTVYFELLNDNGELIDWKENSYSEVVLETNEPQSEKEAFKAITKEGEKVIQRMKDKWSGEVF